MARGGLAGLLLPPLLAFAVSRLVLSTAALAAGVSPAQPGSWCRFDCGHYTTIAVRGYEIAPCPAGSRDEGALCGNTAWLPGYPLLVRALHTLGIRPRRAAVLVSAAFALLSLALIWAALAGPWAGGEEPRDRAALALCIAAVFPGTVYLHAISPLAVYGVAALLALIFASRGRPLAAGLAGAAAAFTYPPGFLLAPVLGTGFLLEAGALAVRARRAALSAGVAAAGFFAVTLVQYVDTGRWWAFGLIQSHYNYSLRSPLRTLGARIAPLFLPPFEGASEAPSAQTLLVALLVGGTVGGALLAGRLRLGVRERFVALYAVVVWLLPLVIGEEEGGLHRREAALLPLVLLTARLPAPVLAAFAAAASVVAWLLALLFFRGQIV